jgi:HPt (histidine-containing phosphotransfer) domain-containing protein
MTGVEDSDRKEEEWGLLPVLDRAFLARQSMHDARVERDVLSMFFDQSAQLLKIIREAADAPTRREAAHRLYGSASAVGAEQVAEAARRLETMTTEAESVVMEAIVVLHAAVAEARATIAGLLGGAGGAGL